MNQKSYWEQMQNQKPDWNNGAGAQSFHRRQVYKNPTFGTMEVYCVPYYGEHTPAYLLFRHWLPENDKMVEYGVMVNEFVVQPYPYKGPVRLVFARTGLKDQEVEIDDWEVRNEKDFADLVVLLFIRAFYK